MQDSALLLVPAAAQINGAQDFLCWGCECVCVTSWASERRESVLSLVRMLVQREGRKGHCGTRARARSLALNVFAPKSHSGSHLARYQSRFQPAFSLWAQEWKV
jgi:hypothetical protein